MAEVWTSMTVIPSGTQEDRPKRHTVYPLSSRMLDIRRPPKYPPSANHGTTKHDIIGMSSSIDGIAKSVWHLPAMPPLGDKPWKMETGVKRQNMRGCVSPSVSIANEPNIRFMPSIIGGSDTARQKQSLAPERLVENMQSRHLRKSFLFETKLTLCGVSHDSLGTDQHRKQAHAQSLSLLHIRHGNKPRSLAPYVMAACIYRTTVQLGE